MKRTSLTRRTPLRAKTALVGASPLARSSRLTRTAMARKRPQRSPEEAHGRRLLRARSGGVCEIDGHSPATDAHHRQNRSQGGTWQVANLLHLCHPCHMTVTTAPALAWGFGWSVRSTDDPATTPARLAGHGWAYLDARGGVTPTNRRAAA